MDTALRERATRLGVICAEAGFDLDQANPALLDRMSLLAERSQTVDDAIRLASYAQDVFRHYDDNKPAEAFSIVERRTIVLACIFSDIGKSGPEGADAGARRLIVEMFGVEGVRDETMPVSQFLRTYFEADFEQRIGHIRALGLDPNMSIRQFWNLHSEWTLAIIEATDLPREAIVAAATHHLLDNVNPRGVVGEDDRFTSVFGENTCFDRAEKLVILLDKYDAVRRRGRRSHEQAIEWLRERVDENPRFARDPELTTLIGDVDLVLKHRSEE